MNNTYIKLFKEHLQDNCNYPDYEITSNTYKYDGKEYDRVEVQYKGYVIQAFILMSVEHCQVLDKFPFYRAYNQYNDFGYLTPPACNVAVYREDLEKWEIHSSNDLRLELTSPDFLNYDSAVGRFNKRLDFAGNRKLKRIISILSKCYFVFVAIYFTSYALSINGLLCDITIPLNAEVVSLLILMIILLLLPPIIPYIKSIAIKGFCIDLSQK